MIHIHERRLAFVGRRAILASGVLASVSVISSRALSQTNATLGQLTEAQRKMLTSLPVTSWLSVCQTTTAQVQANLQRIVNQHPGIIPNWGQSEITGGPSVTISSAVGHGLLDEKGLRIFSLIFDPSNRLELVTFMFDRGWAEANVDPLVKRITRQFSRYATPAILMDNDSEASDKYFVFDIGKFVIEIAVPQFGTFIPVYFTTKDTHRRMRIADSTYEIFKRYFERSAPAL